MKIVIKNEIYIHYNYKVNDISETDKTMGRVSVSGKCNSLTDITRRAKVEEKISLSNHLQCSKAVKDAGISLNKNLFRVLNVLDDNKLSN